ncbi:uncharacterized protein V6R79_012779 [Siganus canaliculatus]
METCRSHLSLFISFCFTLMDKPDFLSIQGPRSIGSGLDWDVKVLVQLVQLVQIQRILAQQVQQVLVYDLYNFI